MIVSPFRPLRYRPANAGRLDNLVSPPYDVIGPRLRTELARRNPFNVVRLILPEGGPERYVRAARRLERWEGQGVLARDPREGFFPAVQEFRLPGRGPLARLGFFGLLEFSGGRSAGTVLAHERTFKGPRRDRERMLRACRADLEAILLLYSDPDGRIDRILRRWCRKRPFGTFREIDGSRCRVWRMDHPVANRNLQAAIRRKAFLIADGHHRFASSRSYWSGGAGGSGRAGILAFFCRVEDAGVVSLPTHRCVTGIPANRLQGLLPWLRRRFRVESLPAGSGGNGSGELAGRFTGKDALFPPGFRFGLRVRGSSDDYLIWSADGRSRTARPGVEDLEERILAGYLELPTTSPRRASRVAYLRDGREAVDRVDRRQADAAFLLSPIPAEKVLKTARDGRLLPPKSTYFFPKLSSGVVLRPFDG